ncbi:hypothetical protein F5Y16DRAFT_397914 [Xylariaceae sp. FL0255]|nr:hypothetical protein F5Y16DRAFT_397914 [Xylariaceae sp. FL0255]
MWNGERFYRTGDRAKRTDRGLEWAGRVDRLVKNRGFLVNLESEVVPALLRFETVRTAATFIWRTKLIGCVQPVDVNIDELRTFIIESFDHFIIPNELLAMEQFPLTANGKVDLNVLRAQIDNRLAEENADRDGKENISLYNRVRLGFANVLLVPSKSLDANSSFAKHGGNSLMAIKLSQYLLQRGAHVSIQEIVKGDTIGNITASAEAAVASGYDTDPDPSKPVPMTDMQKRMISQSEKDPANNTVLLSLRHVGSDAPSVTKLRDTWMKQSSECLNWHWTELVVSSSEYEKTVEHYEKHAFNDVEGGEPVNLEMPHCAVTCIAASSQKRVSVVTIIWRVHHVLIDGFSLGLLLDDVEKILARETLPPAPSFRAYARFFQDYKEQNMEKVQKIWGPMLEPLSTNKPLQIIPPSQKPIPTSVYHASSTSVGCKTGDLVAVAKKYDITPSTAVYAAWAIALKSLTNSAGVSMVVKLQSLCSPLPTSMLTDEVYYTHFNTMVQSFLGLSENVHNWQLSEKQPPPSDLVWFVYQDGADVRSTIQVMPRLVDLGWAEKVNEIAAKSFHSLVKSGSETDIGYILASIA